MNEETYTTDYDVADMEASGKELNLFVCSTCGLIASELVEHADSDDSPCILQDWWHLNVKCFVKDSKVRYGFKKQ